jgi:hypothetical protein
LFRILSKRGGVEVPVFLRKLFPIISLILKQKCNNITGDLKLKCIRDMKDCDLLLDLSRRVIMNGDFDMTEFAKKYQNASELTTIDAKFEFIEFFCREMLGVRGEINLDLAKRGDEFELAKIADIILFHGAARYLDEITSAFDAIPNKDNEPLYVFYSICEQFKTKIPPTSVDVFEAHIGMSEDKRKSLSSQSHQAGAAAAASAMNNINYGTPNKSLDETSYSNSPAYLVSPMQRTNLSSPAVNKVRRKIEEDYAKEMKKMEREIKNKEFYIEDLLAQIKERTEALETMGKKKVFFVENPRLN